MKKQSLITFLALSAVIMTGCSQSYKKTKTGLVYKIISVGNSKDSVRTGNVVKINFVRKLNDSVLYSSFGKMPYFIPIREGSMGEYSPTEAILMMKKGDSAITIEMADTLIKKGLNDQLPPGTKNGDRFITYIKLVEIFTSDSAAQADYAVEMEKDRPRQIKEQEEQMAKMQEEMLVQKKKEYEEMVKSGEAETQLKEVEDYLKMKGITNAVKTGLGTYVLVNEKGSGAPVENDKYIKVKYTGKLIPSDSTFEANEYAFKLGHGAVIQGWDEGLLLFNQGGKGTLYIPAYQAYGKNSAGPGGKANQPLLFDVEILEVSDEPITQSGPAH